MGVSPAGGGRAVRGSACAPLLRNGSAAPTIPDAGKEILEAYLHSGIPKTPLILQTSFLFLSSAVFKRFKEFCVSCNKSYVLARLWLK